MRVVADIERESYRFIDDLAVRHGRVEREGRVYFAPDRRKPKEALRLPDFDRWRSLENLEIKNKAQELYHSLAEAWISYKGKDFKGFEEVLMVLSSYVKEDLAGIRVFLDGEKPVVAIYNLSLMRGLYLVLKGDTLEEVLDEVFAFGLDKIRPEDILDIWFMEWTWRMN